MEVSFIRGVEADFQKTDPCPPGPPRNRLHYTVPTASQGPRRPRRPGTDPPAGGPVDPVVPVPTRQPGDPSTPSTRYRPASRGTPSTRQPGDPVPTPLHSTDPPAGVPVDPVDSPQTTKIAWHSRLKIPPTMYPVHCTPYVQGIPPTQCTLYPVRNM